MQHLLCYIWSIVFDLELSRTRKTPINSIKVGGWCTFHKLHKGYLHRRQHQTLPSQKNKMQEASCSKGDSNYIYIYIQTHIYILFTVRVVRQTLDQGMLWNLQPKLDRTWATLPNFEVIPAFCTESCTRWAPEVLSNLNYVPILRFFSKIFFFLKASQTFSS